LKDATIHSFYLTVGLGMGHYSPSYVDLLFIIEVDKHASHELGAILGNDHVHDPILVYNLLDELNRSLRANRSYKFGLNPLGELVNHDKQVIKAPEGRREFPDEVESPNGEGPHDWDCLEFLRGDVFLLGKILTSLASPHNMLCVLNRGGPIKSLSKGFTHQGVWCCMVATSTRVYILQEFYPILCGYAPLQDFARAFMIDFVIPHNVGFISSSYSIGFIPVDREDAMS
jgi:hypothetical protein